MSGIRKRVYLGGSKKKPYIDENRYDGAVFYRVVRSDNQPELDYMGKRNPDEQGFAAFGKVIAGMDVVRKIHRLPVAGQTLIPSVKIHKISRLD